MYIKNELISDIKGVLRIKLVNLSLDGSVRTYYRGKNYKKSIIEFLKNNNLNFKILNENFGDIERIKLI